MLSVTPFDPVALRQSHKDHGRFGDHPAAGGGSKDSGPIYASLGLASREWAEGAPNAGA